jgi:hypothetical protein
MAQPVAICAYTILSHNRTDLLDRLQVAGKSGKWAKGGNLTTTFTLGRVAAAKEGGGGRGEDEANRTAIALLRVGAKGKGRVGACQ